MMNKRKAIGFLAVSSFLATAVLAGTAAAYERIYTLGEKIDGATLVVWAEVLEARELSAPKAKQGEPELVGDYLYRLRVKQAVKGPAKLRAVTIVQSPEYRADPRYYEKGRQVLAFLKPAKLGTGFLKKHRLPAQAYYETFGFRKGVTAVDDSSAPALARAVGLYLQAKRTKPAARPAKWAELLSSGVPDMQVTALMELMGQKYYPALDHYLRALADENLTGPATKILTDLEPDSLAPRLPILLLLDRSSSRRIRVNMLQVVSPIDDERVYKLLLKSLKDENFDMRAVAARGLERWKDPKAVKSLKKALKDEDDFVRDAAAEALRKMGFEIEKKKDGYYRINKEPKLGKT
jgi:hypothetical protein